MQDKHEDTHENNGKKLCCASVDLNKAFVRVAGQVTMWAVRKSGVFTWQSWNVVANQ